MPLPCSKSLVLHFIRINPFTDNFDPLSLDSLVDCNFALLDLEPTTHPLLWALYYA